MAVRENLLEPLGHGLVTEDLLTLVGTKKGDTAGRWTEPRKIVVEGVEVAIPLPTDFTDRGNVPGLNEVVPGLNLPTVDCVV
jgi:hypothetical protein